MSKFKVGDRVIAIETHPQFYFFKGDEFYVHATNYCPSCNSEEINIGEFERAIFSRCRCGFRVKDSNTFSAFRFRKLEPRVEHTKSSIKSLQSLEILRELANKPTTKEIIEVPEREVVHA